MQMMGTKCIKSISSFEERQLMQSDFDAISHWSSETELFFNKSKFAYFCFWTKPSSNDLPQIPAIISLF